MFVGYGQELQGGFAGVANALLPAFYRVGAYVHDAGERRLAYVELLADGTNLVGAHGFRRGRQLGDSQRSFLPQLIGERALQRLLQVGEEFYFLF